MLAQPCARLPSGLFEQLPPHIAAGFCGLKLVAGAACVVSVLLLLLLRMLLLLVVVVVLLRMLLL